MRYLILVLCVLCCGCAFTYDSRGQNVLDISNPKYKGITAEGAKIKTGRLIELRLLTKEAADEG